MITVHEGFDIYHISVHNSL